jgi:tyrosyl-tRNA synthetase
MQQQERDASQRIAQHLLAKEIVSLAHGASSAMRAEKAHKEAFSDGTHTFSLSALRKSLSHASTEETLSNENNKPGLNNRTLDILTYKKSLIAKSALQSTSTAANESTESIKRDSKTNIVTLPSTFLQPGSFPRVLYAAGLVASASEGHRLIKSKGAYVVLPNSGSVENPNGLVWEPVPTSVSETDPNHYLIDWEALVIRSGKSKIQVVHIVQEERFEAEGLSFPGWEEFKAKRAEDKEVVV